MHTLKSTNANTHTHTAKRQPTCHIHTLFCTLSQHILKLKHNDSMSVKHTHTHPHPPCVLSFGVLCFQEHWWVKAISSAESLLLSVWAQLQRHITVSNQYCCGGILAVPEKIGCINLQLIPNKSVSSQSPLCSIWLYGLIHTHTRTHTVQHTHNSHNSWTLNVQNRFVHIFLQFVVYSLQITV